MLLAAVGTRSGRANGAGGGQRRQRRAVFENRDSRNACTVRRELEHRDSRRADPVLYCDETFTMPIQAVDAAERCVRAWRNIRAGRIREIVLDDSERIRDVNRVIVAGKRNSIWIKERAVEF